MCHRVEKNSLLSPKAMRAIYDCLLNIFSAAPSLSETQAGPKEKKKD